MKDTKLKKESIVKFNTAVSKEKACESLLTFPKRTRKNVKAVEVLTFLFERQ
jgi:hypothetical protein